MERSLAFFMALSLVLVFTPVGPAAELYVGTRSCDVTPDRPVLLHGQFSTRIAREADTPLEANLIVFESREGDQSKDRLILVSIDMCLITTELAHALENALAEKLPEIDAKQNMVLAATHTHTSFETVEGQYRYFDDDVMSPSETVQFVTDRISDAIVEAWKNRVRVRFSYGFGYARIGWNRRAVYEDGSAVMYGGTDRPDFVKLEGMTDDKVGSMFFWDAASDELLATIVNVSCPSQCVESLSRMNADYWHPARESLKKELGENVVIVPLCGAAGDVSPHLRFEQEAETRMLSLRRVGEMDEIARRITNAVTEVYPCLLTDRPDDIVFAHQYAVLKLPQNPVPKQVCEECQQAVIKFREQADAAGDKGMSGAWFQSIWNKRVVDRYEQQQGVENPTYDVPVHVFRIGQSVFCTNPFELYTDYDVQIKARSAATQTFVVQLATPLSFGGYMPSEYAVQGGGYGAIPQNNYMGPPAGKQLVEETLHMIDSLFSAGE